MHWSVLVMAHLEVERDRLFASVEPRKDGAAAVVHHGVVVPAKVACVREGEAGGMNVVGGERLCAGVVAVQALLHLLRTSARCSKPAL